MNFGVKINTGGGRASVMTGKVTQWIQAKISQLGFLSDDASIHILVQEMECTDPDCVPLEVLVALLGVNARWTTKILKPLNDVTVDDVEQISFPGSWSSYVETYREYGLKKTQLVLYEQIEALSSQVDECGMKLTGNERMALTTLLQRIINKVQLPLPLPLQLSTQDEMVVPTTTMPIPSSQSTFVPMMFKSTSSPSQPTPPPPTTTKSPENDTISSSSSSSSSSSCSTSNNSNNVPPPSSPPPTIPPPAPPTYPKPASLQSTMPTSTSALSGAAPPSRRHDKGDISYHISTVLFSHTTLLSCMSPLATPLT